jgi:F1F0 ATPase subunit 2
MNETLHFVLALVLGLALGIVFFGGLWLTVKKTVAAKMPALWILGSFIFRVGITMIGFYYVSMGNWQRLIICLLGFTVSRYIVIRLTRSGVENNLRLKKEAVYES